MRNFGRIPEKDGGLSNEKIFTKSLSIFMAAAFFITILAIFLIQTLITSNANTQQSREKLSAVREKLQSNDEEIKRLTENLGENNLAKSRAFADLLAADPSILINDDNLDSIMDRLMVNELHVIDGKGIITNSTVDAYIWFDMGSGEQSAAFLVIIENPSIELVQEPQQNSAEGIIVQYVGVARKDAPGFVQVGIQPESLEKTLESTAVDVVLNQMIVVSISIFIIFVILLILINKTADTQIVSGLHRICGSMSRIADGDFEISVNEEGNEEFKELSDSINRMVSSIKEASASNEDLLKKQIDDMETSVSMIEEIKNACQGLDSVAHKTTDGADSIEKGVEAQKIAALELANVLHNLEEHLNSSANETSKVTGTTKATADEIEKTREKLTQLGTQINEISNISKKIEDIISEIEGIASQTNLLALNASIEAARAGEAGRGFAVVATEVGDLAARSSQAAKETNDLIRLSVNAVNSGKAVAESTVAEFSNVVAMIEKVDMEISDIAGMVRGNVEMISEAVQEVEKIENVVESNLQIAHNSKQISSDMETVAEKNYADCKLMGQIKPFRTHLSIANRVKRFS